MPHHYVAIQCFTTAPLFSAFTSCLFLFSMCLFCFIVPSHCCRFFSPRAVSLLSEIRISKFVRAAHPAFRLVQSVKKPKTQLKFCWVSCWTSDTTSISEFCSACVLYGTFSEKLLAKEDPGLYHHINQGCLGVDGMDDQEEMRIADVCTKGNPCVT